MQTTPTTPPAQRNPDPHREATLLYLRAQLTAAIDRGDDVRAANFAAALADLTPRTFDRHTDEALAVTGGAR